MGSELIGKVEKERRGILIYLGGLLFLMILSIYPIAFFIGLFYWIFLIASYEFNEIIFYSDYILIKKESMFLVSFISKVPYDKVVEINLSQLPKDGSGVLRIGCEKGFPNISMSYVNLGATKLLLEKIYLMKPELRKESILEKLERIKKAEDNITEIKRATPLVFYLIIIMWPFGIFISFISKNWLIAAVWTTINLNLALEIWYNKLYLANNSIIIKKAKKLIFSEIVEMNFNEINEVKFIGNKFGNNAFGTYLIKSITGKIYNIKYCSVEKYEYILEKIRNSDKSLDKNPKNSNRYVEKLIFMFYFALVFLAVYESIFNSYATEYFPFEKIIKYSIIPAIVLSLIITRIFKNELTAEKLENMSKIDKWRKVYFSNLKNNFIILILTISLGGVPFVNKYEVSKKNAIDIKGEIMKVGNSKSSKVLYIKTENRGIYTIEINKKSEVEKGREVTIRGKIGNLNMLYDIEKVTVK